MAKDTKNKFQKPTSWKKCFQNMGSMKWLLTLRCKKSVNLLSKSNIAAPKPQLSRVAAKFALFILGVFHLSYIIRRITVSESVLVMQKVQLFVRGCRMASSQFLFLLHIVNPEPAVVFFSPSRWLKFFLNFTQKPLPSL